ncbi:MAG: hypothetical protein IKT33_03835 [Clostridia bacterium]|nr:hypothetical protein [Clostridia bacterium]
MESNTTRKYYTETIQMGKQLNNCSYQEFPYYCPNGDYIKKQRKQLKLLCFYKKIIANTLPSIDIKINYKQKKELGFLLTLLKSIIESQLFDDVSNNT